MVVGPESRSVRNPSWLEVAIEVPREAEDLVAGVIAEVLGSGSRVEEVEGGDVRLIGYARGGPGAGGRDREGASASIERLRRRITSVVGWEPDLRISPLPNDDWLARWREGVEPVRVSKRVWAVPPWRLRRPAAGEVVLILEPSLAFGTGHHESTRLAMEAIEQRVRPGGRYLDLGCGTGILAMGALALGAGKVLLAEIDPDAREIARRELRRNGFEDGTQWTDFPLPEAVDPVDGIFANITLDVIRSLLVPCAEALREGGWIVVSGILTGQRDAARSALRGAGFRVDGEAVKGEWWSAVGIRP